MQFRTQIPAEAVPSGIVLVQTDQGHDALRVRLPVDGQPGDTILFDIPSSRKKTDEPLKSQLEYPTTKWWCCPNGIVASEWVVAFFVGLWIGFALMLGFALGTLSLTEHDKYDPEL